METVGVTNLKIGEEHRQSIEGVAPESVFSYFEKISHSKFILF